MNIALTKPDALGEQQGINLKSCENPSFPHHLSRLDHSTTFTQKMLLDPSPYNNIRSRRRGKKAAGRSLRLMYLRPLPVAYDITLDLGDVRDVTRKHLLQAAT